MNIIIYFESSVDPQKGGVERMSLVLADMLSNLGHNISFLCWNRTSNVKLQYPLYYLPKKQWHKENDDYIGSIIVTKQIDLLINQAAILPVNKPVCTAFRRQKVPIIQVFHNSFYGIYSRIRLLEKLGQRSNFVSHLLSEKFIKNIIICLYKIKYKQYYRDLGQENDYFVLLSDKYREEFVDFCKPKNMHKLYAIPNPITFSIDHNDYKKEKIILFCGRMDSQKRPMLALKIWERIAYKNPNWKMIMIGDGDYLNILKKYANQHFINNVDILGKQNPIPFYKRASILCMTSAYEGLPLVLLEAFNFGCVPVAFNTFACASEIISNDKDGILVKENSEIEYIEKLQKLMNNQTLRVKMRNRRFVKLAEYSPSLISSLWSSLLNDIELYA